ncbi:SDR family oxidoreductase [Sphingomonas sp. 8AM]|uniref:SDR family oxidoreductase n=1 Tax=Sphingomonas sp. 8AM TaxID=2653170 RepID=UPI0012F46008|nr:SDR family oxidoreductase [Sphingomonas sp. 8AM]VXD01699.1 NAD(P)H:quinone oxidoreductase [Sphingomonas sp. 8AM]
MTIAVTGATGQLGRLVVERLTSKVDADGIVALARSPDKAADLGVAVRAFDYARSGALAPALAGVDTLLLVSSNAIGQRTAQHRNVIAAAKEAGIGRIVYTSLLHADTSPLDLAAEHRETEAALAAAGVPVTILRNGWYTENYLGAVRGALANGVLIGSAGGARIASAARADYAEAAAVVLTGPGHEGRTYELAGDLAWTLTDLAAELSRQSGQEIAYENLPAADYAAALRRAGMPDDLAAAIAGWDVAASNGALFDDGRQLSMLIGRPTTPLPNTVAAAIA